MERENVRFRAQRVALGEWLRERRKLFNFGISEVARAAGVSHPAISALEDGRQSTENLEVICRLADKLQISRKTLLERIWVTRDGLALPVPPPGSPLRRELLAYAVASANIPESLDSVLADEAESPASAKDNPRVGRHEAERSTPKEDR